MSTAAASSSHRFPPGAYPQNYNSRYADNTYSGLILRDAHEENPESILDDHVQRVMKTPGCQSPGTGRHSPKSRSPDGVPGGKGAGLGVAQGKHPSRHGAKGDHLYHHKHMHHMHHAAVGKPREQGEAEAAMRVHGNLPGAQRRGIMGPSLAATQTAWDPTPWITQVAKVAHSVKGVEEGTEGNGSTQEEPIREYHWVQEDVRHEAQQRNNVQPSHPFIQDPTMPPNPAPSPLIQLEEVCRRLEEEKIQYVMEVIQRGRTAARPALFPPLSVVPAVSDSELSQPEHKATKKHPCENTTVAYYFCEELIPYRTSVKGRVVTLGQFKELLTKKGNYRYYFKKVSDEFDCGVVFEEVREDDAILPIFEEKIIGKVEKN
ncbi:hypothetical protein KUCAC02_007562 [Chaenocephalus aceratus]|uniref:Uncharacterized protein n=1 Tax=Chaenocephalus aceratus TaxID=36190 RepID=A0ACB9X5T9_CHAAC|nr:hypothetical protein KUCAC02_007562 [Chaenocephalus aceratus]